MTDTQRGIVLLLKSAITGQSFPLPPDFDMEEASRIAVRHHIVPLVYTGAALCGIGTQEPVMQQLFLRYIADLRKSELQLRQLQRIFSAFDAEGIDYLPLKGCSLKQLYPKPELRPMGDADILIRLEQYPRIVPIMEGLGFTRGQETDHELIWHTPGLFLELHKHLIPSYNPDYYAFFGNGWQLARAQSAGRYALEAEDEFVFLFTHFAKHYRDGGAGCRYILDLWVFLRENPGMDTDRIRASLSALRLPEFFDNVMALLDWWFGDGEAGDVVSFLSAFIFSSGTWGQQDSHLLSIELRNAITAGSFRRSKLKYKLNVLFPPAQAMAKRWPVLQRHRWMTPVFWPVRWATALLFRRENIRKEQQFQDFQNKLTGEDLCRRQQALQYVGLDFHF